MVCLKQPSNNLPSSPKEGVVQVFFPRLKRSSKVATQEVVASTGRVVETMQTEMMSLATSLGRKLHQNILVMAFKYVRKYILCVKLTEEFL